LFDVVLSVLELPDSEDLFPESLPPDEPLSSPFANSNPWTCGWEDFLVDTTTSATAAITMRRRMGAKPFLLAGIVYASRIYNYCQQEKAAIIL
jgi:hypothetical protein